jgi:Zn-finger nucleic acid-binding protein
MKCPNCEQTLLMTSREGIEIDYCPNCRGVWLDKGELDKIIEKTSQANYSVQDQSHTDSGGYSGNQNRQQYSQDNSGNKYGNPHYQHKKKSPLDNIFDIFD